MELTQSPPTASPAIDFKASVRPAGTFSCLGPVLREGKKAVLRRLSSENSDLKRSIARINEHIAATEAENRVLEQSIQFFNAQLRRLGILPVLIDEDTDRTSPPEMV
jgi:hypothetical protein